MKYNHTSVPNKEVLHATIHEPPQEVPQVLCLICCPILSFIGRRESSVNGNGLHTSCGKVYKTVRGLDRHVELWKKNRDPIDKTTLPNLLELSIDKVSQDECFPEETRVDALNCVLTIDHQLLHANLLQKLFCNLSMSLDADIFYR